MNMPIKKLSLNDIEGLLLKGHTIYTTQELTEIGVAKIYSVPVGNVTYLGYYDGKDFFQDGYELEKGDMVYSVNPFGKLKGGNSNA